MDASEVDEVEANPPGTPRRGARSPRSDRTFVPPAAAVDPARDQAMSADETPLIASRSLKALLRLDSLHFKLESAQPTGSWLDRGTARITQSDWERTLGVVGAGPLTLALAVQCARVGRQLVVLLPAANEFPDCPRGWLEALGARIVALDASENALRARAPEILAQVGGEYVGPNDFTMHAGFRELLSELASAREAACLLSLGSLTGDEPDWLAEEPPKARPAVPFPLDGMQMTDEQHVHAVVGSLADPPGPAVRIGSVVRQPVSTREAMAAQRLLAREEGIVSSLSGSVGLAGLIRAVSNDRRLPVRGRRLPHELSVVVVVTCERAGDAGLLFAANSRVTRVMSLEDALSGLRRILVTHDSLGPD